MNVSAGAKTDPGQRANNEDHYLVVDTRRRGLRADGVLVVADGMGGRASGEQAAQAAVEAVDETLAELLDSRLAEPVILGDALSTALRKANARVYALSQADPERQGMGTTCVAAVIEGDRLYLAHAGDSRAYLLRGGTLSQLTSDHSYVAEQVRAGAISEEGARKSRFRNIITRAVGIEPALEAEVTDLEIKPGDTLLLCTDGLSNIVDEADLAKTLGQSGSAQAAADKLVSLASRAGGKDNITAVVARLQAGTRTLRMQVADLVRPDTPAPVPREGGPIHPAHDGQHAVRPEFNSGAAPHPRRGWVWPALAAVFLLAGMGMSGALASLLTRDGYRFQAAPPFAVPPAPPAPPPTPVDPGHVAYDAPAIFYAMPVRGSFLSVNPQDGAVTTAPLSGTIVGLPPGGGGQPRYKYKLPFIRAQAAAPEGVRGAGGVTLHTATDPQGNLYVSDAIAKTVTKYKPNGEPLGLVARSSLTNPQAIGVAADGTIYLIDAERLKVFKAHPSPTPLPPIPVPAPPQPAALVAPLAVPPVSAAPTGRRFRRGYRHSGYRRYGAH